MSIPTSIHLVDFSSDDDDSERERRETAGAGVGVGVVADTGVEDIYGRDRLANACAGLYYEDGGLDNYHLQKLLPDNNDARLYDRKELVSIVCSKYDMTHTPYIDIPIKYIPPRVFNDKFIKGRACGSGSYGDVFECRHKDTGEEFVVKQFKASASTELPATGINEINHYATVKHQGIIRPVAWTYNGTNCIMLILPRGMNVKDALARGYVSIDEVIASTFAAVAYLNREGIAHGDIKPGNMVYHDGIVKLIDFGLATKCDYYNDNNYRMYGMHYTEQFRDPEYVDYANVANPISVELLPLVKSWYNLLGHRHNHNLAKLTAADRAKFNSPLMASMFNELVDCAKMPLRENNMIATTKPTVTALYDKYRHIMPTIYEGDYLDTPIVDMYQHCTSLSRQFGPKEVAGACNDMLSLHRENKRSAREFFLCLFLFLRTINMVTQRDMLNIHVIACMYLASSVNDSNQIQLEQFDDFHKWDITDYAARVFAHVNGIISGYNPWDYADSAEQLALLYRIMLKCNYNPYYLPSLKVKPRGTAPVSPGKKNISCAKLIRYIDALPKVSPYMFYEKSPPTAAGLIISADKGLPISGLSVPKIKYVHTALGEIFNRKTVDITFNMVAVLNYCRSCLHELSLDNALFLYSILRASRDIYSWLYDRFLMYDINDYSTADFTARGIHPFAGYIRLV